MLASVVVVMGVVGVLVSSSPSPPTSTPPPYRLPGNVAPVKYNLNLLTDIEHFKFNGTVDILIECKSATDTIKLHSVALKIENPEVSLKQDGDGKDVAVEKVELDTQNEFVVIKLASKLSPKSLYRLHIPFRGQLTDHLSGYYRSSYTVKSSGAKEWVAVTQFEPTDARRAFPCFDEPAMKANFTINLGHKEGLVAISNMPVANSKTKDGWTWDEFKETVPMSTYLIAFMVSNFKFRESEPEPNKVQFRVWAREEAINQVEFTRKYGPKFLSFLEDFFMIPYPLPKQDNVALPDFSAGAMENWGLITYRESSVLVDEKVTATASKYNIANTVAHELAHQWFGNLVTMKWWTDLWLNEGFATYVASLALKHQFPEWNSYNYDVSSNFFDVFSLDALESSHPVSVPIGHPNEINQIFDHISYSKGSLLLHMMNSFLGEDIFRAGVKAYLEKFKYGNSEQDDLWASLTTAAKGKGVLPSEEVTVKDVMDKWTLQTGFPVLSVKREGSKITLTQKRFLALKPKARDLTSGCWWIPLTYSTAKTPDFKNTKSSHWFGCKDKELTLNTDAGKDDWIIFNNKAAGIYKVNYDSHSWELIIKALNSKTEIDELNRFLLVADAMSLAHIGELDYTTAFRVLKYVQSEAAYIPWRAALGALEDIEIILWRTDKYPQFMKLVQALLADVYEKFSDLESVPEGLQDIRHKLVMVRWACKYDVGNCAEKANQLFQRWMKNSDNNPIPKDLRAIVYCKGVEEGGEKEWEFVWRQYLSSNIANEKQTFLKALSCTRNQDLIKRFLELSIDKNSGIRLQDSDTVFYYVTIESQKSFDIAKEFFEKNIQRIHDYVKPNTQELGRYVKGVAERLVHRSEVDEMKKFVETNAKLLEKSKLSVEQGLESAEANVVWMESFYKNIDKALTLDK